MIDVHAHINDPAFDRDRDEVIDRALNAGIKIIIDSSLDSPSGIKSLALQKKYPGVLFASIGMDPIFDGYEEIKGLILKNRDNIVGIGEVGLDFFKEKDKKEGMIFNFRRFISLAKELSLPLIVHSRNAGREAINILIEEGAGDVVMHAYDGKISYAILGAEQGFHFSIPPSVLHSEQKQKLAEALPVENLLLESDSPVLGPERGKRNEPQNLALSLRKLSELKKIEKKKLETILEANTRRIFRFYPPLGIHP